MQDKIMKRYSFLDAAFEILKIEDNLLTANEITRRAIEGGLIKTKGETPSATMYSVLFTDIQKKGKLSRFIKPKSNQFGLIGWADRYGVDIDSIQINKKYVKGKFQKYIYGFTNLPDYKIMNKLKMELDKIRYFLKGSKSISVSDEGLCFWVWFCYNFSLYKEGAIIFRKINEEKVPEEFYKIITKIGVSCENKI